MSKRHTYQFIKNEIEKEGYILVSNDYINAHTNLDIICPNGHEYAISWNGFSSGRRCKECYEEIRGYARRTPIEEISDFINNLGFKILSGLNNYKNYKNELLLQCPIGHEFKISFNNFKSRKNCPTCNGYFRYDLDFLKDYFASHNCVLLEDEYKNMKTKMNYICECGNKSKITLDSFMRGGRCNDCKKKKISEMNLKYNYEKLCSIFKEENCLLLTPKEEYHGVHTTVSFVCDCGNKDTVVIVNFLNFNSRCKECAMKKRLKSRCDENGFALSFNQKYIHSLIGGELNYPVGSCVLDIAFPKNKIYFEYDGGGHDLSVKLGSIAEDEFRKKEMNRYYFLRNNGWKSIRIISKKDYLPTDKKILDIIYFSKKYLQDENHSWITFDIDSGKVMCSKFEMEFDFEYLRSPQALKKVK